MAYVKLIKARAEIIGSSSRTMILPLSMSPKAEYEELRQIIEDIGRKTISSPLF